MDRNLHANLVARLRANGASRADAEDCVQDVLADWCSRTSSAGESLDDQMARLETESSARYLALTRQRARVTPAGLVSSYAADSAVEGPEEQIVQRDHARFLVSRLRRLPPTTQRICRLVARGYAPSTLSNMLGLSARSIESHLTRARRLLRNHGALGWVAILAAAVAVAARRAAASRLAATAAAAAVSAGVVVLPVGDTPHPTGPVTAEPRSAAPIARGDASPPAPPARPQDAGPELTEPTAGKHPGQQVEARGKRPPRMRRLPVNVLDRVPAQPPELPAAAVSAEVPGVPSAPASIQFPEPAPPVAESSVVDVSQLVPQLVASEPAAPTTVDKPVDKPGNAGP